MTHLQRSDPNCTNATDEGDPSAATGSALANREAPLTESETSWRYPTWMDEEDRYHEKSLNLGGADIALFAGIVMLGFICFAIAVNPIVTLTLLGVTALGGATIFLRKRRQRRQFQQLDSKKELD
jgi:LPXTG-motif cell wall-anchored protein